MPSNYLIGPLKSRVSTEVAPLPQADATRFRTPERPRVTSEPMHLPTSRAATPCRLPRQALLPRLQARVARITGIAARHVHWVWSDAPLTRADTDRLAALLRYGDAVRRRAAGGALIVVAPRLGTVSPWASRRPTSPTTAASPCTASSASPNSASRSRAALLGARQPLDAGERAAVAALLHDRMTESVLFERDAARAPVRRAAGAEPMAHVDVLGGGRAALARGQRASSAWRCRTTRSTTWSTPSPAWGATRPTSN